MTWHLLLVEDEASVREAFALRLDDQGYVVQTSGSGEEALAALRSFEPDVLVLDLVMLHLPGLEVLTRVKQFSPHLPVIVLTARGTVKDAVEAMRLGAFDFVAKSIDMLANPQQPLLGSLDMARVGYQVISDVAALAIMPDDSPTALKGKPVGKKVVAWSEPMPLDKVKAIGKALGCSINDVLPACVGGAIGAYLQARGEAVEGKEIRAMVPVNLRPMSEAWKLGNRFGGAWEGVIATWEPTGEPDVDPRPLQEFAF